MADLGKVLSCARTTGDVVGGADCAEPRSFVKCSSCTVQATALNSVTIKPKCGEVRTLPMRHTICGGS